MSGSGGFHLRQMSPDDRDEVSRLIFHSTNRYYVSIGREPIFKGDELSPSDVSLSGLLALTAFFKSPRSHGRWAWKLVRQATEEEAFIQRDRRLNERVWPLWGSPRFA